MSINELLWRLKYHVRDVVQLFLDLCLADVSLELISHVLNAPHYFRKVKLLLCLLHKEVLWKSIVDNVICVGLLLHWFLLRWFSS